MDDEEDEEIDPSSPFHPKVPFQIIPIQMNNHHHHNMNHNDVING